METGLLKRVIGVGVLRREEIWTQEGTRLHEDTGRRWTLASKKRGLRRNPPC